MQRIKPAPAEAEEDGPGRQSVFFLYKGLECLHQYHRFGAAVHIGNSIIYNRIALLQHGQIHTGERPEKLCPPNVRPPDCLFFRKYDSVFVLLINSCLQFISFPSHTTASTITLSLQYLVLSHPSSPETDFLYCLGVIPVISEKVRLKLRWLLNPASAQMSVSGALLSRIS